MKSRHSIDTESNAFIRSKQNIHISEKSQTNISTDETLSENIITTINSNGFNLDGCQISTSTQATNSRNFYKLPVVDIFAFNEHIKKLNEDQLLFLNFLNNWFLNGKPFLQLIVCGGPGTGKSFCIMKTFEYLDCEILKMAYTRKIANSIGGSTIHKTLNINYKSGLFPKIANKMETEEFNENKEKYINDCHLSAIQLSKSYKCLNKSEIIIIDEIGMVPVWLLESIFQYFGPNKLYIFIGDEHQLRPVKCKYNIFNLNPITLPCKIIHLTNNNRFTPEYHKLIKKLRENEDQNIIFDLITKYFPVKNRIVETDLKFINIVLTYTNEKVNEYNNQFLDTLPGNKIMIPTIKDNKPDLRNCLILKQNCPIIDSDGNQKFFYCYLPDIDKIQLTDGNLISRNYITGQFAVMLPFAVTIHKYQGETIDLNGIVFDFANNLDFNLIYTALSRVRSLDQIYAIIL